MKVLSKFATKNPDMMYHSLKKKKAVQAIFTLFRVILFFLSEMGLRFLLRF